MTTTTTTKTTAARPPGPRDRAFGLALLRAMRRDYLGFWRAAQQRHGDTLYMRHAWTRHYVFMHPEQIRAVLVDEANAFVRYEQHVRVMRQVHGDSLLVSESAAWQRQRRAMLPAFAARRFEDYARHVDAAAQDACAAFPAAGGAVDVEHAMNMLAVDVILRTMFGARLEEDMAPVEQAIRTLGEIGYAEMFLPFPIPAWAPLPRQADKRAALRLLDGLIRRHIRARRASGTAGDDLLGMLLAAGCGDREARDQLMTAFLAGHETTATALAWTGWALAAHPDVAARAAREVDAVLGGRAPCAADLARLPWLQAIVKESLRRYPPLPSTMMRRAVRNVDIGGWRVPAGSVVTLPTIVTHLDARWFSDPLRFDPARFMDDAAQRIPRGAWLPFGAGPRTCIGNNFAMMEMTLVLARLLQGWTIRPAPGQQEPRVRVQVTLRPEGGMRLVLAPRQAPAPVDKMPTQALSGCPFH